MTTLHSRLSRIALQELMGQAYATVEDQAAAMAAAMINDAEGYAIVELPEQMEDKGAVPEVIRSLPMWAPGDAWTCLRDPDLIEFEADGQQAYGECGATAARNLAAALLAAAIAADADAAEVDV